MKITRIALALALGCAPLALAEPVPSQNPRIGRLAELKFSHSSDEPVVGSENQLGKIAAWARDNPDAHVVIDGHADRRGPKEANRRLSMRRAEAVRTRLVTLGVDPDQIVIAAYGESGPRTTNNRRVVVWGTRSGLKAIQARSMARGEPVILGGMTSRTTGEG